MYEKHNRSHFQPSLLILICMAGYIFTLGEAHQRDRALGLVTFASPVRQCFNYRLSLLRDPSTAYLLDSDSFEKYVLIDVAAKNGFGAYGKERMACPKKDGSFNRTEARTVDLLRSVVEDTGHFCDTALFYQFEIKDRDADEATVTFELECEFARYQITRNDEGNQIRKL